MIHETFQIGNRVIYVGELNSWTYSIAIKPHDKGIVENVMPNKEGMVYSIKFDTGLTTSIDEEDLILDTEIGQ